VALGAALLPDGVSLCAPAAPRRVKELQRKADGAMVVALAANKVDLRSARTVDSEEAAAYARSAGLIYVETSAKENINVDRLFVEVAKRVPMSATLSKPRDTVALGGGAGGAGGASGSGGGGGGASGGCGCGGS